MLAPCENCQTRLIALLEAVPQSIPVQLTLRIMLSSQVGHRSLQPA